MLSKSDNAILLLIKGESALERFKDEVGKHCVQRIPPTETKGRTHTSIVSVSVLPIAKVSDFSLREKDIEIQVTKGSGPGGQNKNKVSTAIRMIHKPTKITVFIDGRSQKQNKLRARQILERRVAEKFEKEETQARDKQRLDQLSNRSRSGKVRTYNFKKNRVVDHRRGTKTTRIHEVMNGRFDLLR